MKIKNLLLAFMSLYLTACSNTSSSEVNIWEFGVPPYPIASGGIQNSYNPQAVYTVLTDVSAKGSPSALSHFGKQVVLIITKDNRDRLKNNYTDEQVEAIIASPDFPDLFPEFQDLYRVSFRMAGDWNFLTPNAYCDLNVVQSNGDTCYSTTPTHLVTKWSDRWEFLKPHGIQKDGNFTGVGSERLLQELYKEDRYRLQIKLNSKHMYNEVEIGEFIIDTHGLKEALKQL